MSHIGDAGSARRLLDDLPDALVVHRDGRIVFVNQRALELLRYERLDELVTVDRRRGDGDASGRRGSRKRTGRTRSR